MKAEFSNGIRDVGLVEARVELVEYDLRTRANGKEESKKVEWREVRRCMDQVIG